MIRNLVFLVSGALLFIFFGSCNHQNHSLSLVKADTGRVWRLHDSSHQNVYSDPVLAMAYARQEKYIAEALQYDRGIIRSLMDIGNVFWITGNYPDALENHLAALKMSDTIDDQRLRARCYGNMGIVYKDWRDYNNAIGYGRKALEIDLQYSDTAILFTDYNNIGEYYETLDIDSAKAYQNKAEELARKSKDKRSLGRVYVNFGNIRAISGERSLALQFYYESIPRLQAVNDYHSLNQAYLGLAGLFGTSNADSTIHYAKAALKVAQDGKYSLGSLNANLLLYELYKKTNIKDSTLKYLQAVGTIQENIYSVDKALKTQSLTFEEQRRQADALAEKKRQDRIYRFNIQYAAIAAFIPGFFLFVLLLGRFKVRAKFIETLGLFGLLLLFEFLTMVLHHYFADFTDEKPVYMLPLLAGVAAILLPFHHKMQVWLKSVLIKPEKKKGSGPV